MRILMLTFITVLMLINCNITTAQEQNLNKNDKEQAEERIRELIKTLESGPLRSVLEDGHRGDGIHHPWMDKMKQFGIKQAEFSINFLWENGTTYLRIVDVSYLRTYERFDTEIKDKKLLRTISRTGLAKDLEDAIIIRAKKEMERIDLSAEERRICGELYLNLVDDEFLPILDQPGWVDDGCAEKKRKSNKSKYKRV